MCFANENVLSFSRYTTNFIDLVFLLNFSLPALHSLIRVVINFRYNISVVKLAVYFLVYVWCVFIVFIEIHSNGFPNLKLVGFSILFK